MSAGYKFAVNQIWRHVKRELIVPIDRRWYELNMPHSQKKLWMQTPFWSKVSKESLEHVWEDYIKINLGKTGFVIVDWMCLVQSGNSDDSRNIVVIYGFKEFWWGCEILESEGFWWWCITLRITGFWTLSIVHNSK
jgi:hypothetical protein